MPRHSFEFNGVVRLTRIGTTYVLATVVLAMAALNTGNNSLYIAVSFMLGSLLLSGLASKGGLKNIEVAIAGVDEAWAGRVADGALRVRNRSRIWNVRDVIITSPDLDAPVFLPVLRRRSEITVPATFLFSRRGLARLQWLDSYTRYPFGFFVKKRRMRVASEVVVFPAILSEDAGRDQFRPIMGEQSSSNRAGIGTEIHSFREFVRGDSLRHVYWKKSASIGRWIMKQTELDAGRALHVVVDLYKPRSVSDDDFESMITSAATLLYHAARRGLDVTLTLPRQTLRAREAEGATALFHALALVEPSFEPVHQILDRDTVLFTVSGGPHAAKSA
ncbi:MAG TPA: DUF58 domain-containing protein [Thermoanaerobaculia bacterium]|nr:DUF58 domain-containing protein [Thermoanaerobaculia bacterium]